MKRQLIIIMLAALTLVSCGKTQLTPDFNELQDMMYRSESMSVSSFEFHLAADGYGWKWVSTNEILSNNKLSKDDFYKDLMGMSPSYYYFEGNTFTQFWFSDARPAKCFSEIAYEYRSSTIWRYGMAGSKMVMKVLSINSNQMVCIEYLGVKGQPDGTLGDIYGLTVYSRMTEEELAKVREEYNVCVFTD